MSNKSDKSQLPTEKLVKVEKPSKSGKSEKVLERPSKKGPLPTITKTLKDDQIGDALKTAIINLSQNTPKPKKERVKRILTEEQKDVLRERLIIAREARKIKRESTKK